MAWYRTGTVAVTLNSKTVTGTGTGWSSISGNAIVGSAFRGPDGRVYEVQSLNSDTSITLVENYLGSTASSQAYALMPTLGLAADLAVSVNQLVTKTGTTVDSATATGKLLLAAADPADARAVIQFNAAVADQVGPPWTTTGASGVPTSGAFSNATSSIRYKKVGRVVFFTFTVSIVSNGTGAGAVQANLPFASAGNFTFAGRENAVTGALLQGYLPLNSTALAIYRYDNAYPGGDNRVLVISGVYEANA